MSDVDSILDSLNPYARRSPSLTLRVSLSPKTGTRSVPATLVGIVNNEGFAHGARITIQQQLILADGDCRWIRGDSGCGDWIPIQEAREKARRQDCKNRLKQVGIGLHNYHETHKTFPPGWVANGALQDGKREQSAYSWEYYILPNMVKQPLYKMIHFAEPFHVEVQRVDEKYQRWYETDSLGGVQQDFYRCVSDTYGPKIDLTSSVRAVPTSNYVGNFGVGIPRYGRHYSGLFQGIFAENSRLRISEIRDGTSNVMLVSERRMVAGGKAWAEGSLEGAFNSYWPGFPRGTSPLAIVGSVTDGEFPELGCDPATIVRHKTSALNLFGQLNGLGGVPNQPQTLRFAGVNRSLDGGHLGTNESPEVSIGYSSHHPGGANIVYCDGSVRFASVNTDASILTGLARRSDVESQPSF